MICLAIFAFEFVFVFIVRVPILIMVHVHSLTPLLHSIKKFEGSIRRSWRKFTNGGKIAKIEKIKIYRQPWVEQGMIRCGDPKCKMMHQVKHD